MLEEENNGLYSCTYIVFFRPACAPSVIDRVLHIRYVPSQREPLNKPGEFYGGVVGGKLFVL